MSIATLPQLRTRAGPRAMRILHVEDSEDDAELVRQTLLREWPDCAITWVEGRAAFIDELRTGRFDVILSDFALATLDGLEALRLARESAPETPFIFLSGNIGEDCAIEALRAGAVDYILKDRMKRLGAAIGRALRERDERRAHREQADMLNQAREAIFITDLDHRLIYWNAGAERLYGWKTDAVMGRTEDELFDPAVVPQLLGAREHAFSRGQWSGELRMHTRQGEPLFVESRQTLIRDERGAPKARLCINSDITGRKQLEEQFLRAQRMENIGLLAAGIAHDLNNMLAPILLAAPMLREYVTDSGAVGLLSTLESSAERGANLVRQILAFAHGTAGERQLLQVKHLLRDISSVVSGTFPKSIRFEDHIAADLWPIVANGTQVHQVMLNLCVNARDAMPNGGSLQLGAQNITLDEQAAGALKSGRPGTFVVLHVEDTGTGIAPEVLEKMWEPFFTTKEVGRGTGLGLSTVRGIVEAHGGFIEVRTALGHGSSFRVFFPAEVSPASGAASAPIGPTPAGRGELILVVDDERRICDMTLTMLTRSGYRVLPAADGAEAVLVFAQRSNEVRLVITDLHMPNLDGAMLAQAVRRINPATKVLAVSGLSSSTEPASGVPEDFADGFLAKPFKPEALLAKVHALLQGHEPGSAGLRP